MGIVPVEHAWCVDADGLVVDTVWDEYQTDYVGEEVFALTFTAEEIDYLDSKATAEARAGRREEPDGAQPQPEGRAGSNGAEATRARKPRAEAGEPAGT